ncbi:MAG: hypothetical protein IPJ41_16620 [Phycisphaerales bacterium]|nr:hypothetical protein [Phycisphaerales bacterium]
MTERYFVAALLALSAGVACAAPPQYQNLVAADAPILWYQCNEASGPVLNHGSLGSAFDANALNGVTRAVATFSGDTGVGFDANLLQYLESIAPAPAGMTGNPSFTAEAVAYITGGPNLFWSPFLHWGAASTGKSAYFSLWYQTSNRAFAGFYNGGLRTVCQIPNGNWAHVVWVRDSGSGSNNEYTGSTLYVNGIPVALERDTNLPGCGIPQVTATTFRVGAATDFNRHFSGVVDEIALYDRLLTPEEIHQHFAALLFPKQLCGADFNHDCAVNTIDVLSFLNAWTAREPYADINGDGNVNTLDVLAFLNLWATGC